MWWGLDCTGHAHGLDMRDEGRKGIRKTSRLFAWASEWMLMTLTGMGAALGSGLREARNQIFHYGCVKCKMSTRHLRREAGQWTDG